MCANMSPNLEFAVSDGQVAPADDGTISEMWQCTHSCIHTNACPQPQRVHIYVCVHVHAHMCNAPPLGSSRARGTPERRTGRSPPRPRPRPRRARGTPLRRCFMFAGWLVGRLGKAEQDTAGKTPVRVPRRDRSFTPTTPSPSTSSTRNATAAVLYDCSIAGKPARKTPNKMQPGTLSACVPRRFMRTQVDRSCTSRTRKCTCGVLQGAL